MDKIIYFLSVLCALIVSTCIYANPQEGTVVSGSATIHQAAPGYTEINQLSDRAVIDWKSFNISENEHTHFIQPSPVSAALNTVSDGNPTNILGRLSADGQIYLINPAGIFFGKNATVDVTSFLATTYGMNADDFMAYQTKLIQTSGDNPIENAGSISIVRNGFVMLATPGSIVPGGVVVNIAREGLPGVSGINVSFVGKVPNLYFRVADNVQQQSGIQNNNNDQMIGQNMSGMNNISNGTGVITVPHDDAKAIVDGAVNMNGIPEATDAVKTGSEINLVDGHN